MDTQFAFRISKEMLAELHKIADAEERTIAYVVRRALKQYVEEMKKEAVKNAQA